MYVLSVKTQNELAFFKCFSLENNLGGRKERRLSLIAKDSLS